MMHPFRMNSTRPQPIGDLKFENGDLKIVKGFENARQQLRHALSIARGELFYHPLIGSHFSEYYWAFIGQPQLLDRFIKLEIARLISIPISSSASEVSSQLNFINRILKVNLIKDEPIKNHRVKVNLTLEWGNGSISDECLQIYVHAKGAQIVHADSEL